MIEAQSKSKNARYSDSTGEVERSRSATNVEESLRNRSGTQRDSIMSELRKEKRNTGTNDGRKTTLSASTSSVTLLDELFDDTESTERTAKNDEQKADSSVRKNDSGLIR